MHESFWKGISILLLLILATGTVTAVFTIEPLSPPHDYAEVSANSPVAQVVRLLNTEGEPVNQTWLDSKENLVFNYRVNSSKLSMNYIGYGYYYADFITNSTGSKITYQLVDKSATSGGEVNITEDLKAGDLDVNILTDLGNSEKAGSRIELKVQVENTAQYYAVDVDNSGSITAGDEFILDRGGSGTYSGGSDKVLEGISPENGAALSAGNLWKGGGIKHPLMVNDSTSGDGWDDSNDIIVIDMYDGGTVSRRPDNVLNRGNNTAVDASPGKSLTGLSGVSSSIFFVSSDEQLESGEAVVRDSDGDGIYTSQKDMVVAGNIPLEGTSVNSTDSIDNQMGVSSYDAVDNDAGWDHTADVLARDYDRDAQYTSRKDVVLAGSTPSEARKLNRTTVNQWEDGDTSTPTAGEVSVLDYEKGNDWNPRRDAIWLENGSSNGYQSGEDTALAGNPTDGMIANVSSDRFGHGWTSISAYQADGDCCFDPVEDSIIRDFRDGGTYSSREDKIIAGAVIDSGTPYTVVTGFDSDWELDVIDQNQGGAWSSNQDTILIDYNEGGTYSAEPDEKISAGGSVEGSAGTALQKLNNVSNPLKKYADLDSSGSFTSGDEIFVDYDEDSQYTSIKDKHIGGISLRTAGEGRGLRTYNVWQGSEKPILFHDGEEGDEWNSSEDSVIYDLDEDGVFTSISDVMVSDEEGTPEAVPGDSRIATSRDNFTGVDVTARFTTGANLSESVILGRSAGGNYTATMRIPEIPNTPIILQVRAETENGNLKGLESEVLATRKKGIGFGVEDSRTFTFERAGKHTRNITVENFLEEQNTISINVSESLENVTNLPDSVTVSSNTSKKVELTFNVTPVRSLSGEIVFTEKSSGMTDEMQIDIEGPVCAERTEKLCYQGEEPVIVHANERENVTRAVTLKNIWMKGSSYQVTAAVSQGISDYLTMQNAGNGTFELADTREVELIYQPKRPGNHSGILVFSSNSGEIRINTTLEANVTSLEKGLKISNSSVDLGAVPQGSDQAFRLKLANSGNLDVGNLNASSGTFRIQASLPQTLPANTTETVDFTINSIDSTSGTVTVTGETDRGEVQAQVQISATLVTPLSQMKSKINTRISNLRTRASSADLQTRLTNLKSRVSSLETKWSKGNYREAQSTYQSMLSSLNSIESQISTQPVNTSTGNPGGGTGNTGNQSSGGGGGGLIIIVAVILLLLLLAGFVIYTSYYPEEGDPLYDVMGDRE
ncbi:MAG: hypothetical protein ABEJ36_03575 [Candidatus Nanosalina sp.]